MLPVNSLEITGKNFVSSIYCFNYNYTTIMRLIIIYIAGCCQPLTIVVRLTWKESDLFSDWHLASESTLELMYLGHSNLFSDLADFYSADIVLSAMLLLFLPGCKQNQFKWLRAISQLDMFNYTCSIFMN